MSLDDILHELRYGGAFVVYHHGVSFLSKGGVRVATIRRGVFCALVPMLAALPLSPCTGAIVYGPKGF